jgi:Flp pilus assembly protein CpaB
VIALLQVPAMGPEGQQASQVAVLSLFQNVLILAVGQDTGGVSAQANRYTADKENANTGAPLVTLALTPQEASFVAFVQEQGKIRLTLRSPADAKMESTIPANWNSLFQYLMPVKEEKPVDVGPKVEIYRGLNKEEVPLSK